MGTNADYIKYTWNDAVKYYNAKYFAYNFPNKKDLFKRFILSYKFNIKYKMPLFIYRKENFLFLKAVDRQRYNLVIFCDLIPTYFDTNYFNILNVKYNIDFVFLFCNDMKFMLGNNISKIDSFLLKLKKFYVFSFDFGDCRRYKLHNFITPYPYNYDLSKNETTSIGFFYVGCAKSRQRQIETIFTYLTSKGFKCLFL